jgi:predicted anti-sigma-YlaC factor YlaD
MLMCKQVSHLVSEAMDRQLSFRERAGLKTHLLMCRGCRNFVAQMKLLREAMRRQREDPPADDLPPAR